MYRQRWEIAQFSSVLWSYVTAFGQFRAIKGVETRLFVGSRRLPLGRILCALLYLGLKSARLRVQPLRACAYRSLAYNQSRDFNQPSQSAGRPTYSVDKTNPKSRGTALHRDTCYLLLQVWSSDDLLPSLSSHLVPPALRRWGEIATMVRTPFYSYEGTAVK
jgi:hypothetical protein